MRAVVITLLALGAAAIACSDPVGKVIDVHKAECLDCTSLADLERCVDGADNDEDYLFDCDDPDCAEHPTCKAPKGPENQAAVCNDGVDNDDNGYTDCEDFGCIPTLACKPATPGPEDTSATCQDKLDNDHDGHIDCRDDDCRSDAVTVCEGANGTCADGIDNDSNGYTDCQDFSCSQNNKVTVCN